jgi:squalene-associated FAD-dependent desaturase
LGRTVHIIGGGLSGLAAAVDLASQGYRPVIHEAGPQAGGRCRSYFDAVLKTRIDNGNHLLLSGNRHAMRYLDTIGSRDTLQGPSRPVFAFIDLKTRERWTLQPSRGRIPFWLFDRNRRVPGTRAIDYLEPLKLAFAGGDKTVGQVMDKRSALYHRLWEPLAVSALNTSTDEGSARLFWAIVRETLGAGGQACIPLVPKQGLSESFVDPALAYIAAKGGTLHLQHKLSRLHFDGGALRGLDFGGTIEPVEPNAPVVLAVTAPVAAGLVPGLKAPQEHRAILNLHYAVEAAWRDPGFIGVVGGTAEWVFQKPGILSVTVSAADRLMEADAETLAEIVWSDLSAIYKLPESLPAHRVVKEKRATFAATPAQAKLRPPGKTRWQNLWLAGDWTATGYPGTIEGSIRSGQEAASRILKNA